MADAKTKVEPTEAQIEAAAECMWNDRDARMGGAWKGRDADEVCVVQTKATAKAALIAALSAAPHPAASDVPHDVVRALDEAREKLASDYGPADGDTAVESYWTDHDALSICRQIDAALATPAPSTSTEEALRAENARLRAALRNNFCPRPCNHRPDQFEVGRCVDAGECGCMNVTALSR